MSQMWKALLLSSFVSACSGADPDADAASASVSDRAEGTTTGTGGASAESINGSSDGGSNIAVSTPRDATPGGVATGAATSNVASGGAGASPAESDMASAATSSFVTFVDPGTGFQTEEVHDADREVVQFDPTLGAMVWSASGASVSGWATNGTDLRWSGSGVPFRVRFGTEAGQRRAFFTEAGPGTICNLSITAPESLSIRATNETPPNP